MPTPTEQAKIREVFEALGVTQQALESIRRLPFAVAKQRLIQLKGQAKQNYRRLALDLHPDRTGGDPVKEELFKLVDRVYRDFQKVEVQPPRPQPQWVVVQAHPVTTTTATTTGTTTWTSWSQGTTNVSRPRTVNPNPRHVVNMRP